MKKLNILIAVSFVVLLALPTAQKVFKFIPGTSLGGVENAVKRPVWTLAGWFDGSLQDAVERRYAFRLALRPHGVKTWNQIHYAMFGMLPPRKQGTQIAVGSDNHLFEFAYIQTYNRHNTTDEADLKRACANTRRVQDLLSQRNIGFLLLIAPSKVEVYPELVPAALLTPGRNERTSAYDRLAPLLREAGVNVLDMHAQFLDWKQTSPYPLFPKGGVHWNYYSAALVADRVLEELGAQTGRTFPRIRVDRVVTNSIPEGTDDDLFKLLNLWGGFSLWSSSSFRGVEVHPELRLEVAPDAIRPNLLIVGDSFALTLTEIMDRVRVYDRRDTLFYFKRIFSYTPSVAADSGERAARQAGVPLDRDSFDMGAALHGRDAVVIEVNEQWLPQIGFGFIDAVLTMNQDHAAPTGP